MKGDRIDPAAEAIGQLLADVSKSVEFGPLVSDDFKRGYAAARQDIVPTLDVGFTEILEAERRRRRKLGAQHSRGSKAQL